MATLNDVEQDMLPEMRERLIHIEDKINILLDAPRGEINVDHKDQMFGGRTYAQHGDDVIVMCLLHSMGISNPTYLDIGAHHPFNISNTALLYKCGGRGINVEPNPNLFVNFSKMRPEDVNLNVGVAPNAGSLTFYMIDDFSGRNTFDFETADQFVKAHPEFSITKAMEIEVLTINDIIHQYASGKYPDFLSIDVEGLDEGIIASADFSMSRPKVICVEISNASGEKGRGRISEILEGNGYYCVMRAVSNLIFVDDKYLGLIK